MPGAMASARCCEKWMYWADEGDEQGVSSLWILTNINQFEIAVQILQLFVKLEAQRV